MGLGDEDIEFLQNSPYKLTIPLEELISPADKTPHKSKKNQSVVIIDIKINLCMHNIVC